MHLRPVALCAYPLAFAMIIGPGVGVALQVWPVDFGSPQWRFGFGGLYANALMMPAMGMLALYWASQELEHRAGVMAFTVLSLAKITVMLVVGAMFLLDYTTLMDLVGEDSARAFQRSSVSALANFAFMSVVFITYAIQGMRTLKRPLSAGGVIKAGFRDATAD